MALETGPISQLVTRVTISARDRETGAGSKANHCLPEITKFCYHLQKKKAVAVDRKFEADRWHLVAIGAGVGATCLFLLFLYAPNGIWKVAVTLLLIVALIVMMWNPRYRLLALGTAAAATGVAGFVTELSLNVSATLPGNGVFAAGVMGGSDVPPIYYLLLFFAGVATVAFDAVGRGWIWASKPKPDPARPELAFSLSDTSIALSEDPTNKGAGRFYLRLSASKADGADVKIARVEIMDAEILEFGVGDGDGVQKSATIDRTGGSDLSVLGTFPWTLLSHGPAERTVAIIDEFDRNWTVGKVIFQNRA